jgi:hypothetical protein
MNGRLRGLASRVDKEEAIAWMKRAPFRSGVELEIRQLYETEDLAPNLPPELVEQEERLRARVAGKN